MRLRSLRWAGLALVGLTLAVTFFVVQLQKVLQAPVAPELPAVLGQVPDFELINRDGSSVRLSDLAGRPWVADFVFTRCALSCPRLTSLMRRLGADAPGVARVSFTVDPQHDTPEVLADYAAAYAVSDPSWWFVTGAAERIESIVVDGFKLPIVRDPPPQAANPDEPILHSNRFVLVDGTGAIRGYYEPTDEAQYEKLLRDLASLYSENETRRATVEGTLISTDACVREIEDLHGFFEAWFVGSLPETEQAFARFEQVLAETFVIIGPGGLEFDRSGILERVRQGYGSKASGEFALWIENVRLRECGEDRCLATYEEWQRSGDTTRGRISTVVFGARSDAPNGVEWRHLQETWLAASEAAEAGEG